jgi:hypothetical protein
MMPDSTRIEAIHELPGSRARLKIGEACRKRRISMKRGIFITLVLLAISIRSRAEDLKPPPSVRRMEYIRYQAATHSVEWGVSQGTITDDGKYLPPAGNNTVYSLDLESGELTHDGETAVMSPGNAYAASLVFEGVARLMATYTDNLDGDNGVDSQESGNHKSGDSDKAGTKTTEQPGGVHRRSPAGHRLHRNESLAQSPARPVSRSVAVAVVLP